MDSSDSFKPRDPFQPFPAPDTPREQAADLFSDPFAPTSVSKEADPNNFANFSTVSKHFKHLFLCNGSSELFTLKTSV